MDLYESTGREEWDEDYRKEIEGHTHDATAQSSSAPPQTSRVSNAPASSAAAVAQQLRDPKPPTPFQPPRESNCLKQSAFPYQPPMASKVARPTEPPLQPLNSLKPLQPIPQPREAHNPRPFRDPNALKPAHHELATNKDSWKNIEFIRPQPAEQPRKSKTEWADLPATSHRMRDQRTKDVDVKKYLGAPPKGVEHKFMGFFRWTDEELLSNKTLRQQWDRIRLERHVYVSHDRSQNSIVIQSDNMDDVRASLRRIRGTLINAEANEQSLRARYLIEPPPASIMHTEVIATGPVEGAGGGRTQQIVLSGRQLSPPEQAAWAQERSELVVANQEAFRDIMKGAMTRLCELNSGMRMRVQFGFIELKRFRRAVLQRGFPYRDLAKMMSEPQTDADFNKNFGDMNLAAKLITAINKSPELFCPLDAMVSQSSDIKPKQKLIYRSTRGADRFRFEAEIDLSARNEYQMGACSLFDEGIGLKPRLSINFLGFENKFHWSLEVLSKDIFHGSSQTFNDIVRRILSSALVKRDIFGFPYPTLRPGVSLNHGDEAYVDTTLQYKLRGQPFVLEMSLHRSLETDAAGSCGVSMYSRMWDDHMGPKEGEDCDRWDLGSNLQALFPPDAQQVGRQEADEASGFGGFLDTVGRVRAFLGRNA